LVESTRRRRYNATEIKWIRLAIEVVDVKKGGRKNIRVIEKNSGKPAAPTYLKTAITSMYSFFPPKYFVLQNGGGACEMFPWHR